MLQLQSDIQTVKRTFRLSLRQVATRSTTDVNYIQELISDVQEQFLHHANQNTTSVSRLVTVDEVPVWFPTYPR